MVFTSITCLSPASPAGGHGALCERNLGAPERYSVSREELPALAQGWEGQRPRTGEWKEIHAHLVMGEGGASASCRWLRRKPMGLLVNEEVGLLVLGSLGVNSVRSNFYHCCFAFHLFGSPCMQVRAESDLALDFRS